MNAIGRALSGVVLACVVPFTHVGCMMRLDDRNTCYYDPSTGRPEMPDIPDIMGERKSSTTNWGEVWQIHGRPIRPEGSRTIQEIYFLGIPIDNEWPVDKGARVKIEIKTKRSEIRE